jgi:hypothetical protein
VELKTGLIEFGEDVRIVLHEATAKDGMYRIVLLQEARQKKAGESEGEGEPEEEVTVDVLGQVATDLIVQSILRRSYANCLSCMVEQQGLTAEDLTFEGFSRLPEALVVQWEETALDLNPHWKWWVEEEAEENGELDEEHQEKKEPGRPVKKPSTSDSSSGDEETKTMTPEPETTPGT